jgi:hypothetical protein
LQTRHKAERHRDLILTFADVDERTTTQEYSPNSDGIQTRVICVPDGVPLGESLKAAGGFTSEELAEIAEAYPGGQHEYSIICIEH